MVRIRVPAVTAVAAVLALSACGSIHGLHGQPSAAGTRIDDIRFPPPPPMPAHPPRAQPVTGKPVPEQPVSAARPRASADLEAELADLHAALRGLAGKIEESRSRLADLEAEVERARARIDVLLEGGGAVNAATPPVRRPPAAGGLRPLVRLRYDDAANADYAEELRDAVWTALERLPDALFEVVAVSPAAAAGATPPVEDRIRLHAEGLVASLVAMGIEPDRLTLSSALGETAEAGEVHLYIR